MNKILAVIVAIVALACGAYVYQTAFKLPMPEHALYYQQPREVKAFSLTDHKNQVFDNEKLKGKWSWMFFGYTSCPDICPTTLQELNFNYDSLKATASNTQVVLVSVDPMRDKPEKLNLYINYFNEEFVAATADHGVLYPFARNLGMMYSIADDPSQENYFVDHSASVVLINPEGNIAAIFKPDHALGELPVVDGEELANDFARIINLYEAG